ncbi:hypothetical protein GCM10028805_07020 [Spirosoma harenae]
MNKNYLPSVEPTDAPLNPPFIIAIKNWQTAMAQLYRIHQHIESQLLLVKQQDMPNPKNQKKLCQLRDGIITMLLAFLHDTDSTHCPLSLSQLNHHRLLVDQKCRLVKVQLENLN